MLEAEFAFARDIDHLCDFIEDLTKFVVYKFQQQSSEAEALKDFFEAVSL